MDFNLSVAQSCTCQVIEQTTIIIMKKIILSCFVAVTLVSLTGCATSPTTTTSTTTTPATPATSTTTTETHAN
jgi:uncharacterized lipoprotein YajG